jgi:N-methylhydantoinase A
MNYTIGTDIGGTFTDCVIIRDDGRIAVGKQASTPHDLTDGFFAAIEDAAGQMGIGLGEVLSATRTLVHATTVGTNAVTQQNGARVGLLATKGHGEAIRVMRGGGRTKGLEVDQLLDIPGTYKPPELVPRRLVREVTERVDRDGAVLVALDEDDVARGVRELVDAGAEAIAISFLWSFLRPEHEQRAREIAAELAPEVFISCSHEVAPQMGEYYRTVATVMNGYLGPLMSGYVDAIVERARRDGYDQPVLFSECVGGLAHVGKVRHRPLLTLDSGPASGVIASQYLSDLCGFRNVITADMGGTTLDVCVLAGSEPQRRDTTIINQYEMYLPMVDVQSIGAGGGSIAWLDAGHGSIKVGPQSAGADPGPVCYAAGGVEPTVTDANVVLGILNPASFLRGRRLLDADAARSALQGLGERVGLTAEETAAGVAEIVEQAMAEEIRRMTLGRGHDPRDFALFAFGGAMGAHAAAIAAELGIRDVVIPLGDMASVFSAVGTVSTDVAHVYERSVQMGEPLDLLALRAVAAELEAEARAQLREEGFEDDIDVRVFAAMKYAAQVYDVETEVLADDDASSLIERFEDAYALAFGEDSGFREAGIQVVRLRLYARGRLERPNLQGTGTASAPQGASAQNGRGAAARPVWWRDVRDYVDTPVYDVNALARDDVRIEGPAILDLPDTTVAVRPGDVFTKDEFGNLRLLVGGRPA